MGSSLLYHYGSPLDELTFDHRHPNEVKKERTATIRVKKILGERDSKSQAPEAGMNLEYSENRIYRIWASASRMSKRRVTRKLAWRSMQRADYTKPYRP